MDQKKYILIGVAGVVVLGGLFLWSGFTAAPTIPGEPFVAGPVDPPSLDSQPTLPPPVPEPSSGTRQLTVEYRGGVYMPKALDIKKGDTVVWENAGGEPMWPASAIHPTHNVYPERGGCLMIGGSSFDSCGEIAPGGLWSFKFNNVGTWRYHDHIRASATGVVNVRE